MRMLHSEIVGTKHSAILFAFALLCFMTTTLTNSFAHPPGSWSKSAIGHFLPLDFAFSDSLNGILLCTPLPPNPKVMIDTIYCFSTIDGGRSWSQIGNPIPRSANKACVDGFASPAVGSAFLDEQLTPALSNQQIRVVDDTLGLYVQSGESYASFGQKMYDSVNGLRLVSVWRSVNSSPFHEPYYLTRTHDGWLTYEFTDCSLLYPKLPIDTIGQVNIESAKIIDSTEIWATIGVGGFGGGDPTFLMHTRDGKTWTKVFPVDSSLSKTCSWGNIELGLNNTLEQNDIYVAGGPISFDSGSGDLYLFRSDFAYSSDGGISWRLDSSFPGRLYRISPTSHGSVWCLIGSGLPNNFDVPPDLYNEWSAGLFADTLYYSTNYGRAWSIDSTTFAGEQVLEMHWLDPNHGWIAALHYDTAFIYRYEAPTASVASNSIKATALRCFPNPCSGDLHVVGAMLDDRIVIYDALGRAFPIRLKNASTVDLSGLPSGIYELRVRSGQLLRLVKE